MSAIERTRLPPASAQSPKAGRRSDVACDPARDEPQFVGTHALPRLRSGAVPTTPSLPSAIRLTRPQQSAVFCAHLIATAQQAPQTRARRRAEPAEALLRRRCGERRRRRADPNGPCPL